MKTLLYIFLFLPTWGLAQSPIITNNDNSLTAVKLFVSSPNTNNSTAIIDAIGGKNITLVGGGVSAVTGISLFGYATIQQGASSYFYTSSSSDFDLGSGDWSVEMWFRWTSVTGYPVLWVIGLQNGVVTNTHGIFGNNSTGRLSYLINGSGATGFNGPTTLNTNTWYWVQLIRSSGTTRLYINAALEGSTINAPTISGSTCRLYTYNAQGNYFNGQIYNLRVSKGIARPVKIPYSSLPTY